MPLVHLELSVTQLMDTNDNSLYILAEELVMSDGESRNKPINIDYDELF